MAKSELVEKENTDATLSASKAVGGGSNTMQAAIQQEITTPSDLINLAVMQGADFGQLEKLMDMKERWDKNEAKKLFTKAMSGFRAECPEIGKSKKVSFNQVKYSYATLGGTLNEIKEALSNNGLHPSWRMTQTDSDNPNKILITVTCIVSHESGHEETTCLTAPLHDDTRMNYMQRLGSTVSYLERYTLYAILGLASADMDNDANGAEYPPEGPDNSYKKEEAPADPRPSPEKIKNIATKVLKTIEDENILGFHNYLGKFSDDSQQMVFSALPDKSNSKKKYREMETKAADISNYYSNLIEDYAVNGDVITAMQLLDEVKDNQTIYDSVYSLLSDMCKEEIESVKQD